MEFMKLRDTNIRNILRRKNKFVKKIFYRHLSILLNHQFVYVLEGWRFESIIDQRISTIPYKNFK